MSRENAINSNANEKAFDGKRKQWNYSDPSGDVPQNQNRTCCSPVDEIEAMENKDDNVNATHSVEVQTDKSTLFQLRQDKQIDTSSKKNNIHNGNVRDPSDNKKTHSLDNSSLRHYQANEYGSFKTTLNVEHEKMTSLTSKMSVPQVFDEYAETDIDQPMDYARCYDETSIEEEKKGNTYYLKNDFLCIEETIVEEKMEIVKSKGPLTKEPTKNKKEMFSNTSRSFKEIFNFFKDRDKKRNTNENAKAASTESPKFFKTVESCERKVEKLPQPTQLPTLPAAEQCDKEPKLRNEAQCSQQTPLMFSRCSSLGSLNGFEQNLLNDDRSSIVSDFSRRTSGVVSPSELPDSPAQTTPSSSKFQQKSQIGCFGKKKINQMQQEKSKVGQYLSTTNDNSFLPNENSSKKPSIAKRSVFEDNLTAFKDESTPTKLHSVAASSLSSLTIDDDDDYELINKIILNKEKPNVTEETKVQNNRQEPIGESNLLTETLVKTEKNETTILDEDEDGIGEEDDELTDLAPYEEQILDQCIRRGIAKWTKQNMNEIKPFSWDIGLTCRATRTMLTSAIRLDSDTGIPFNIVEKRKDQFEKQTITSNNSVYKQNSRDEIEECNGSEKSETNLEANDQFDKHSYYITYEEHLLDECIRRGMAKITKRNMADIKPFSWDTNQICLTTRAMTFHSYNEKIHGAR